MMWFLVTMELQAVSVPTASKTPAPESADVRTRMGHLSLAALAAHKRPAEDGLQRVVLMYIFFSLLKDGFCVRNSAVTKSMP